MLTTIAWIGTIIAIAGNVLINHRHRAGYVAWWISNAIIIITSAITGNWPILGLFAVYQVLAVHGFIKWGKAEDAADERKLSLLRDGRVAEDLEELVDLLGPITIYPTWDYERYGVRDGCEMLGCNEDVAEAVAEAINRSYLIPEEAPRRAS
jgi:hypothetical protein